MKHLRYIPQSRYSGIADETMIILAICFSVIILVSHYIQSLLLLLAFLLVLNLAGGVNIRFILNYIKLFVPVILVIFLIHLFYFKGETLFKIWVFTASDFGLNSGIINILRFVNFLLVAIGFFSFSSPLNVATKLATVFGLAKSRFFQEMALVFFISLRFLPVMVREREMLKLAMRARGIDFAGGVINRLRMNVKLMLPLVSRVLGQTDDVAITLALKGDGGTYFVPERPRLKFIDMTLIGIGIALIIGIVCYE